MLGFVRQESFDLADGRVVQCSGREFAEPGVAKLCLFTDLRPMTLLVGQVLAGFVNDGYAHD